MEGENTKTRQQFVSGKLSGVIKKRRQTTESSSSQQQPQPKRKKDITQRKSVAKDLELLKNAICRWITEENTEATLRMAPLPQRPDIDQFWDEIDAIQTDYELLALNSSKTTMEAAKDDTKQFELVEIRDASENLNEQWPKDSTKAKNLEAVLTNNGGFRVKAIKCEPSSEFLCILSGETATNPSKDQGSLGTREHLWTTFSSLKNKVYDMDNKEVNVSDFQGLKEALEKTTWGKIPDYLKLVAIRIEKDRGKAIGVSYNEVSYDFIKILVCAAIKEMEDLPLENVDGDTLKKWGATLNKAKELGFRVEFAENLLRKNLFAYVAYLTIVE